LFTIHLNFDKNEKFEFPDAVVNFWFNFHKAQLPRASVRAAISTKLLHEHTAKLKSEIDDEAGIAEDGNGQDAE
jgi:hypothetical protein